MTSEVEEFCARVTAVLRRFAAQQGAEFPVPVLAGVAARLAALVTERGLPRPLPAGEKGTPGGMTEAETAPLVARAMAGGVGGCSAAQERLLTDGMRQLVKACFYPEFRECRDSFRQVGADGACRRQELARARGRVSGSHCVDCPHWVALAPAAHARFLAAEWRGDPAEWAAAPDTFLPEDFRALRLWLHAAARRERE